MPANTISCSKVQLAMAVLAAIVIAAVVLAVGYGAGVTYQSRLLKTMEDELKDFAEPPKWTPSPPPPFQEA